MNEKLITALRHLTEGWRMGANEIRDESKALFGRVTADTEVGASTLESCAKRIESILEATK